MHFANSSLALDVATGSATLGAWIVDPTPDLSAVVGLTAALAGKQSALSDTLTLTGTGDVLLELAADSDNQNENDLPTIKLSCDGAICATTIGLINSGNSFVIDWNVGSQTTAQSYCGVQQTGLWQVWLGKTSTSWVGSSDARLKNVLGPVDDACAKLAKIRPCFFEYKADASKTRHIGLLAQEVQSVCEEVVSEGPDGYLGLAYSDLVPLLLQAIKDLTTRIEALEQKQSTRRSAR